MLCTIQDCEGLFLKPYRHFLRLKIGTNLVANAVVEIVQVLYQNKLFVINVEPFPYETYLYIHNNLIYIFRAKFSLYSFTGHKCPVVNYFSPVKKIQFVYDLGGPKVDKMCLTFTIPQRHTITRA